MSQLEGRIDGAVREAMTAVDRSVAAGDSMGGVAHCRDVDLLWCGSVLTHLDAAKWPGLLGQWAEMLADGGIAVVTTRQDVLSLARDADRLPLLHDSGGE